MMESGYFATIEEIESYSMFRTLLQFQRDLSVRFTRDAVVLINGLPAHRRGYRTLGELNDISFGRVRGIEAYPCNEAPSDIMRWLPAEVDLTRCNVIAIWTR